MVLYVVPFAAASEDHEDDTEVENLLHQISDARHASERRDAMCQLRDLLQNNPSVSTCCSSRWSWLSIPRLSHGSCHRAVQYLKTIEHIARDDDLTVSSIKHLHLVKLSIGISNCLHMWHYLAVKVSVCAAVTT